MRPVEYLQQKGIQYKIQSSQIVFNCVFCGETKGHLYMEQEDGVFFCHKCNERGNLITFMKFMGDEPEHKKQYVRAEIKNPLAATKTYKPIPEKRVTETHEALLKDEAALKYITEDRKIGIEVVKEYKLGLSTDIENTRWLTIPHYENGKLVNVKSRSLPPAEKTFRRIKDCKSVLFNGDAIEKYKEHIIITEGCIDALTLITHGIKNVVAVTNGASSFDVEWLDKLKDVQKITLCYDMDDAGQKGAKEAARRLGYDRCYNLLLPQGNDLNDYFQKGYEVYADFQQRMSKAARFDVVGISTFNDCISKMQREYGSKVQCSGLMTGIKSIDNLNKRGMKAGELWIIAAPPGVGKSSLSLQIITNQVLNEVPALFFSLEMNINAVTEKIIQSYSCKETINQQDVKKTATAYERLPLYLGRVVSKLNLDGIIDILREAIKRYGLKILAFDHLHFLCRSLSNQTQEIGLAVQAFKLLAEEMEIPIILVAQPRKVDLSKPMTAEDLKDSSSIHSDADGIIILHRKRVCGNDETVAQNSLDPMTMIRFEKARYGKGGECILYFHGEYSRFSEIDE